MSNLGVLLTPRRSPMGLADSGLVIRLRPWAFSIKYSGKLRRCPNVVHVCVLPGVNDCVLSVSLTKNNIRHR